MLTGGAQCQFPAFFLESRRLARITGVAHTYLFANDPLTVMNLFTVASAHWADANFAQALAVFDDMHRREPSLRMTSIMRMQMLTWLGRIADACEVAEAAVAENPEDAFARLTTAFRQALLR